MDRYRANCVTIFGEVEAGRVVGVVYNRMVLDPPDSLHTSRSDSPRRWPFTTASTRLSSVMAFAHGSAGLCSASGAKSQRLKLRGLCGGGRGGASASGPSGGSAADRAGEEVGDLSPIPRAPSFLSPLPLGLLFLSSLPSPQSACACGWCRWSAASAASAAVRGPAGRRDARTRSPASRLRAPHRE